MIEYFSLESKQDHLKIGVSLLVPDHPRAIVQLVHGMAEHRKRYEPFMEELAKQGFISIMHDHRGHGESIKATEDYGYFYEKGAEKIVEDTHQISEYIKQKYPDLPLILFGHSMGSLVVRSYTKKYDDILNGLIVCGSPSKNPAAKPAKLLVKMISLFHNDHHRSKLIQKLAFGSYNRKFTNVTSENAWICSDEKIVQEYDLDTGCGFIFTLNGFNSLFDLLISTYDRDGWKIKNNKLPIQFISGEDDPCAVGKKNFEEAVNLMKEIGYQNVSNRMYPNMRHEILNENGKEIVYQDIVMWVNHLVK